MEMSESPDHAYSKVLRCSIFMMCHLYNKALQGVTSLRERFQLLFALPKKEFQ